VPTFLSNAVAKAILDNFKTDSAIGKKNFEIEKRTFEVVS